MSNENGNGNHRNGANTNGHQRNSQVNGSVNCNQNGNGNHHIPANGASKNGNRHHPDSADTFTGLDLLWDSLPASVTEKLAQPLDASLVSQRKGRGNRNFSYVEGRTAIDQANRIFGFGGWGHEVVGDVLLRELDQVNTQTGEVKRIRAYSATGAVTDALKRAMRTFGPQFGNSLYGDLANQPAGGSGDTLAPALRKTLLDLGVTQGFDEERVRQAVRGRTGKDLDELPASELTPLVERAARKVQQM